MSLSKANILRYLKELSEEMGKENLKGEIFQNILRSN